MTITYLCQVSNRPVGGVKVLYRHSEMLVANGIDSNIFHPEDPAFSCTWFEHHVRSRAIAPFNVASDFIVIPEIWASKFGPKCIEEQIKYAIFVQNGYLINPPIAPDLEARQRTVYENASLIMSISEDTTAIIELTYPGVEKQKIIRLLPTVSKRFRPGSKKKRIAFMPRKLPMHAQFVWNLLKLYLPPEWEVAVIDNKSEDEVAAILAESAIFLSFSEFEGFGLPPIEAAMAGNVVVGYTGQGAREYFELPIFHEVQPGDFRDYVKRILDLIERVDGGLLASPAFSAHRELLEARYCADNEQAHLLAFASRVAQLIGR